MTISCMYVLTKFQKSIQNVRQGTPTSYHLVISNKSNLVHVPLPSLCTMNSYIINVLFLERIFFTLYLMVFKKVQIMPQRCLKRI